MAGGWLVGLGFLLGAPTSSRSLCWFDGVSSLIQLIFLRLALLIGSRVLVEQKVIMLH